MTDAGFYRGTNSEQDSRFSDKNKKLMKQMKFSDCLDKKVNISKINLEVIKPWITQRLCELLNFEDDVVIEFVINQLLEKTVDPKLMQINLTGFLNAKNARIFMGDLWQLLLSAQNNIGGIPETFVQQKKEEIKKQMEDNAKLQMKDSPKTHLDASSTSESKRTSGKEKRSDHHHHHSSRRHRSRSNHKRRHSGSSKRHKARHHSRSSRRHAHKDRHRRSPSTHSQEHRSSREASYDSGEDERSRHVLNEEPRVKPHNEPEETKDFKDDSRNLVSQRAVQPPSAEPNNDHSEELLRLKALNSLNHHKQKDLSKPHIRASISSSDSNSEITSSSSSSSETSSDSDMGEN